MLTRPHGGRPFAVDDMQRLDRLRPWLAHAFRPHAPELSLFSQPAQGRALNENGRRRMERGFYVLNVERAKVDFKNSFAFGPV